MEVACENCGDRVNVPDAEFQNQTAICPTCACSVFREGAAPSAGMKVWGQTPPSPRSAKQIYERADRERRAAGNLAPTEQSAAADGTTRCPYCSEEIQATAKKCKHCGEWLNAPPARTVNVPEGMFQQGSTDARAVAKGIKQERAASFQAGCAMVLIVFVLFPLLWLYTGLIISGIITFVAVLFVSREYHKE